MLVYWDIEQTLLLCTPGLAQGWWTDRAKVPG